MNSTEPPEAPEYTSEPKALSPVSPKPLHYPLPEKIPLLQKQIDPVFNQMDAHMDGTASDEPSRNAQTLPPNGVAAEHVESGSALISIREDEAAQAANNANANGLSKSHIAVSGDSAAPTAAPASSNVSIPGEQNSDAKSTSSSALLQHDGQATINSSSLAANPAESISSQPSAGPDVPDYSALLSSIALPTSFAQLDHTASFIPLDDSAIVSDQGQQSRVGAAISDPTPRQSQSQASRNASWQPSQVAPGVAHTPNPDGLPPPPVASVQHSSAATQPPQPSPRQASSGGRQRDSGRIIAGNDAPMEEDENPWSDETKRMYDSFLASEREYVTIGDWEQFPNGSRLFVGNLSSERVTKRDVFHAFHKYGKLAQISIKQAYGFVQFLNAADCARAMQGEQGRTIRGKRINLEISKPQKNRASIGSGGVHGGTGAGAGAGRRRSRSPERRDGADRYAPGGSRQGDSARRGRDDYRPGRSPSPRGYRNRSRDRHGRYKSRSRSPRARGGRYRSPSPRRDDGDDLPLPRRAPRDVPDVQIIVADDLDRNFVQWVENGIGARGIKVDVLLLSPRLAEAMVIKRQIVEGVLAVSRLTRINQHSGKIPLQVFDRRGGSDIRFEEYADLDPMIAAEVVLRARSNNQPSYGYGYGAPPPSTVAAAPLPQQQHQQLPISQSAFQPSGLPPQLGSAISSMDANGLQKLLGAMQQQQQQQQSFPTPDLAKLLAATSPGTQQVGGGGGGGGGAASLAHDSLAGMGGNPALSGIFGGQHGAGAFVTSQQQQPRSVQEGGSGQPNMADILAKLGSFRR